MKAQSCDTEEALRAPNSCVSMPGTGTSSTVGNITPTAEFNVYVDPVTADIVLTAHNEMTMRRLI